jgi:hypothetical protein
LNACFLELGVKTGGLFRELHTLGFCLIKLALYAP